VSQINGQYLSVVTAKQLLGRSSRTEISTCTRVENRSKRTVVYQKNVITVAPIMSLKSD